MTGNWGVASGKRGGMLNRATHAPRVDSMTKSRERGQDWLTEAAKREAARTGRNVCDILAEMLAQANAAGDVDRKRKIVRAQKYLRCRNARKRRGKP
jgi:hypothetical protein